MPHSVWQCICTKLVYPFRTHGRDVESYSYIWNITYIIYRSCIYCILMIFKQPLYCFNSFASSLLVVLITSIESPLHKCWAMQQLSTAIKSKLMLSRLFTSRGNFKMKFALSSDSPAASLSTSFPFPLLLCLAIVLQCWLPSLPLSSLSPAHTCCN